MQDIKLIAENLFIIHGTPEYPTPEQILYRIERSYLASFMCKELIMRNIKIHLDYTRSTGNILDIAGGLTESIISIPAQNNYSNITLFMQNEKFKRKEEIPTVERGDYYALRCIAHEITHCIFNIGGCQYAEALCRASEYVACVNDELLPKEIRSAVKYARNNYKCYEWRKGGYGFKIPKERIWTIDFTKNLMMSKNWKDRFIAEYWQAKIRYDRTFCIVMNHKLGYSTIDINLDAEVRKIAILTAYIEQLEEMAKIYDINLGEKEIDVKDICKIVLNDIKQNCPSSK